MLYIHLWTESILIRDKREDSTYVPSYTTLQWLYFFTLPYLTLPYLTLPLHPSYITPKIVSLPDIMNPSILKSLTLKSLEHPLRLHFTSFHFISSHPISGLMGKGLLSHELMTVSPLGTRIAFAGELWNQSRIFHIRTYLRMPTHLPVDLLINLLIWKCVCQQALYVIAPH